MIAVIAFVAILGLLVFVHELGHFLTARRCGVVCDEFGFGFPPRLFGVQRKNGQWRWVWGGRDLTAADTKYGTVYSLNLIPLGGFVKIKGESGGEADDPGSFAGRPIWQRALILVAGVVMNLILAAVLLIVAMGIGVPQLSDDALPSQAQLSPKFIQVLAVNPSSPAERAALQPGDRLLAIDGLSFADVPEVQAYVGDKLGQALTYRLQRGDKIWETSITPEKLAETEQAGVGIMIGQVTIVKYPWYLAIPYGLQAAWAMLISVVSGFVWLITGLFTGQSAAGAVAGPVGIANLTGQMANLGWGYLINFAALLSVNLAVINILPIPALDGGRLMFLAIEKMRGRPLKPAIEAVTHNLFFFALLILIAVVTWHDIARLGCVTCKIAAWFN